MIKHLQIKYVTMIGAVCLSSGCLQIGQDHAIPSFTPQDDIILSPMSLNTYPIGDCPADTITGNEAVVTVNLPATFDPAALPRNVRHQKKADPMDSANDDPLAARKPFHIFLKPIRSADEGAYVRVNVVIPAGRTYRFFADPTIEAVGAGENTNKFCKDPRRTKPIPQPTPPPPAPPPAPPRPLPRSVATFYVKLGGFPQGEVTEASYNIILQGFETEETPIFVDPKIRDEG